MKQLTPPLSVFNTNKVSFSQITNHTKRPLCILISVFMSQMAMAETVVNVDVDVDVEESQEYLPSTQIDTIVVTADAPAATEKSKTVVTSKNIQDNQINNQQDLVRYNPEVSVAEVGRYGSKGFAMRGVDGNRVAMSYDGVSLPDQQINQFFSPYGYMYEGRFSPDTEMLSTVRLQVGADSFTSGSGAVGGAVNYKSKEPKDLLKSGQQLGGYAKTGYTSKNEEKMAAVGLAGRTDKFEALINYAYRNGHELKNHRMLAFNKDKLDPAYDFGSDPDYQYPKKGYKNYGNDAILPDPQHYESHAAVAKVYFHPTDEHRVGLQGTYQYRLDKSNNFTKKTYAADRIGYDEGDLKGMGLNYRYLPLDNQWVDEINANINYQKIIGVANTYQYDHSNHKLSGNQYRPQYDTTTQFSIDGRLLPIDMDKYGIHNLSAQANYSNSDHELILKDWNTYYKKGEYGFNFLGPSVKRDVYNFAVADDIEVNDKFNAKVGVRYDSYTYKPYMTEIDKYAVEHTQDFNYGKVLYKNGEFDKHKKIDNLGGLLALNYKLTPNWQTGYKLSTGFLAPSTSQIYSTYETALNTLVLNPNLEPEKSLNHELSLQGDFNDFSVNTTAFYTGYKDFITLGYYEERLSYKDYDIPCPPPSNPPSKYDCTFINTYHTATNLDSAKTYGLRLGGAWDISRLTNIDGKMKLTGDVNYSKDSTSEGINLLATQPFNGVIGLNYLSANNDYQLNAKMRYLGAKKPDDAKILIYEGGGYNPKLKTFEIGKKVIKPYKFINASESAFIFDLYGSKSFDNGLKMSAGVYNIFDKKYVPWANLRSLAELSVNSMVDREGKGIERYTAPGRNYAIALTYEY